VALLSFLHSLHSQPRELPACGWASYFEFHPTAFGFAASMQWLISSDHTTEIERLHPDGVHSSRLAVLGPQ
jgi:hypothetical protein